MNHSFSDSCAFTGATACAGQPSRGQRGHAVHAEHLAGRGPNTCPRRSHGKRDRARGAFSAGLGSLQTIAVRSMLRLAPWAQRCSVDASLPANSGP